MPANLPTAKQLMGGNIELFSLDTSTIQANGYKYSEGALHQLRWQVPAWMKLQISEVVAREIARHRIAPIEAAIKQVEGGLSDLERGAKLPLGPLRKNFEALDALTASSNLFAGQLKTFCKELRGGILPIAGSTLAEELFKLYFDVQPPFEGKKDKKSEFPDAAALLTLEEYAKKKKTLGVLVSGDHGWQNFAKTSKHLYCVPSLDEFVKLFASSGPQVDSIIAHMNKAMAQPRSGIYRKLFSAARAHAAQAYWRVDNIYTGSNLRVEGEVIDAEFLKMEVYGGFDVWLPAHDPSMCVVEFGLSIEAELTVECEYFYYDSIDGDESRMGTDSVLRKACAETQVFMRCGGDIADAPSSWEIEIEFAKDEYSIDVGEVEPDWSD